jgi:eukaryotic-like serine/threonine-protein kinase
VNQHSQKGPVTTKPDGPGAPDVSAEIARARHEPDEALPPGTVVGRFIVHRTLGKGGAGIVYAAHDPELDRTIALKVLRGEPVVRPEARARFLREAQALARLSHPNVISVYDVGAADGHTFIAMEYIHGQTFADWVAAADRSWSEVLVILLKAGRGLAAAHAAELIHRDFKPTNLLVAADGRVVVTDFGLARSVAEAVGDSAHASAAVGLRSNALAEPITHTGAVQGTPGYVAPEQWAGQPADARADQFSYCVTLYEALFREHPFRRLPSPLATTVAAWAVTGPVQEPLEADSLWHAPGDLRGVPAWLQQAVRRGLSREPADRHATMDSLLTALNREPIRRRRRTRLAFAAMTLAIIGAGLAATFAAATDPEVEVCTGAGERVSSIWNPGVAGQVRAAFVSTARPHAQSSAGRLAERLDAYTREWAAMHRSTCLATARGEQSPDLLDRRMECLERQLDRVGSLLDMFIHRVDGKLVGDAIQLVGDLEPVAACANSAALLSSVGLPADPAKRSRQIDLRKKVDGADLDVRAARYASAERGARAALETARTLDDPLAAARAGRVLGRALYYMDRDTEAGQSLVQALRLAERARDALLATQILIDLVQVLGESGDRVADARLVGQVAEAALERAELRDDQSTRARLLHALGEVAQAEDDLERAIELHREELAIRRRSSSLGAAADPSVALAEEAVGQTLWRKGAQAEARSHLFQTLAIRRRVFGDDHRLVANAHNQIALTYRDEGSMDAARREFLTALAIVERNPEYSIDAALLHNLGGLENMVGNYEQARVYHEKVLATHLRNVGPAHARVAKALFSLGNVHFELGQFTVALDYHRRALALNEKIRGPDHTECAMSLGGIGEDLRRLGRPAEALRYQQRAYEIFHDRLGDNHQLLDYVRAYQGLSLVQLGRRREAIPKLERALAGIPSSDPDRARAAFGLALALEPRAPRSRRARALATEALELLTKTRRSERAEVAAYLARGRARRAL